MGRCNSKPVYSDNRCVVVHADACTGCVGAVCAGKAQELELGARDP